MIDRLSRNSLALLIRRMASGRMSIDQFFDRSSRIKTSDEVVNEVHEVFIGLLMDESFDHGFLRGKWALNRYGKRVFAKYWLLLRSDATTLSRIVWATHKPFFAPSAPSILSSIAYFDLCGERRTKAKKLHALRRLGPARLAWPFSTLADLQNAKRQHTYFSGTIATA